MNRKLSYSFDCGRSKVKVSGENRHVQASIMIRSIKKFELENKILFLIKIFK